MQQRVMLSVLKMLMVWIWIRRNELERVLTEGVKTVIKSAAKRVNFTALGLNSIENRKYRFWNLFSGSYKS